MPVVGSYLSALPYLFMALSGVIFILIFLHSMQLDKKWADRKKQVHVMHWRKDNGTEICNNMNMEKPLDRLVMRGA